MVFLGTSSFDFGIILHFVVIIPIASALIITVRNYLKNKYIHNFLFMSAWICYFIWAILNVFLVIFFMPIFAYIAGISTIFMGFFTIIFLDKISRVAIDPVKLTIIAVLSVIKIISMGTLNAFIITTNESGQREIESGFLYSLSTILNLLFIGLCYVYYMNRIHRNAPESLKKISRLNIWGAYIMGIGGPIIGFIIPDFAPAIIGIGACFTALAFSRQPQLAYILPFKTYRLMVIDMIGGLPLFTHNWVTGAENSIETFELVSAMLAGINGVLKESLHQGGVKEIQLERSLLLLETGTNSPFMSIIITTQASSSLNNALKCFTQKFEQGFSEQIPHSHEIGVFREAEKLVGECFPFVPSYV